MTSNLQDQLILNVDDTDAARYAKTRILTRAGFRVIEASSGGEALHRAKADEPALVLLDVKLPDINGFEVCRRLKEDPATRMVLVLQTSASYIGSADKIRALDGGADNYLFEPIGPEELVANVKALLRLGRVERELREVDRRKDEFLAVLSHELRNPLGPIRNAVELLRQLDPYVPQEQENARQTIIRQTDHMVRLVDDLLDVSRISHGKITLQCEHVELKQIINTAIETARPAVEHRRHKLTVNLPAHHVWVNGDSVRLAQVVCNLLNNAAKFTAPGGELLVTAEQSGDSVLIKVQDNGIGISSENVNAIFNLFEQAEHAPDRVKDGLGIGLSLAKNLAELHGGTVTALSPGLGQGSTFELRLPIVASDQAASAQQAPLHSGTSTRRRILVVDDNVDSAEVICSLLEFEEHVVRKAHDGAGAIELAGSFQPEIVLLDIGLPDMTGFDVAMRLRQLPAMEKSILIALTGYGQEKDKQRAVQAGFDHHLTKPVTFDTLVLTINTLTSDRS
jgi:signal transduction histidine kinase